LTATQNELERNKLWPEMRAMMSKLKLTVNESKTRVCYLAEEKFDFLGYTFGRCYSTPYSMSSKVWLSTPAAPPLALQRS
jgi:hypothetical protein